MSGDQLGGCPLVAIAVGGDQGLIGFAQYERLVGDAGKSPIIKEFGSRNQLSGGLGLSYTFNVSR